MIRKKRNKLKYQKKVNMVARTKEFQKMKAKREKEGEKEN